MADPFIAAVDHLLLVHQWASPICDECRPLDFPKWRKHVAQAISEVRVAHRTPPTRVMDVFSDHAPYTRRNPPGLQCHTCLDGRGGGEYPTTQAWAEHLHAELVKAGLKVVNA
jgi:hypothetical protein